MNKWFERYYKSVPVDSSLFYPPLDESFSDMMYDKHKGIALAFIPLSDGCSSSRCISDVEICMSSDPNVVSRFSAEHRAAVRNGIVNQPRLPVSDGPRPTDDQLMANGGIVSLERDEIVASARVNMSRLDSELPDVPAPSDSPVQPELPLPDSSSKTE